MPDYNLSEGSLQIIMKGGNYPTPIMQVLGSKKINSGSADKERFRILLSDGKHTISFAMLTTQVSGGELETYSVIRIDKYITSLINNSGKGDTRVLLILDMVVLNPGSEVGNKIGNPTQLPDASKEEPAAKTNGTPNTSSIPRPVGSSSMCGESGADLSTQMTHPIASLSPYHNKWIIKARVTNKSAIRTWSNAKGEGKLFSVDLVDESGEIRLTAFRDMVDKYYDYLQVDKIYYITKCTLKTANKQYSTLKNDYEMTMTSETVVQECNDKDDSNIPQTKYDFVTIDRIASAEVNSLIDIVGVVKDVGDIQNLQSRTTGRELKKRDVTLIDQSNTAVSLTLWGAEAENFDGTNNPVVVLKGARISEYGGGKNLGTIASTNIKINPELPECYRLRSWYDNGGCSVEATNISARSGMGSLNTPWISFKEVHDRNFGNAEKGDYYQVMGTILMFRHENAWYKACPTETCNKKVVDLENGMYRCEKCNREFPNFKYRLLASMNVGDWSGNQWISMFSSEVEKVFGMTAEEVGQQIEQNPEAISIIADKTHFKQFIMKCRAKVETYNDEARLKTVCIKVDPINYKEYNAHLMERIDQLLS
ncbi:unnamed protein product [Acanthoscelides obtectus]|uniref:Replication protein A subunit n=2 Tax=Acanthoscelides obtectus TaxID=200917 RepID=A0A9P0LA04_ACAOB|nr:unnamed protein product [Acanthoscelides obtectus]CAK1653271.1 Replication protein A 70 kDa DNA-binding subunit [Acanthoscelides obtectus]